MFLDFWRGDPPDPLVFLIPEAVGVRHCSRPWRYGNKQNRYSVGRKQTFNKGGNRNIVCPMVACALKDKVGEGMRE